MVTLREVIATLRRGYRDFGVLSAAEMDLLQRLENDRRAQDAWSKTAATAKKDDGVEPDLDDAAMFFRIVLLAVTGAKNTDRITAETINNKKIYAKAFAKFKKQFARKVNSIPSPRELAAYLEHVAGVLRRDSADTDAPLIRSDRDGSRARTSFMREVSQAVRDFTGRWLDAEVGVLTEIAFNTPEIVPEDMVRKARRPTTRSGRRKRD